MANGWAVDLHLHHPYTAGTMIGWGGGELPANEELLASLREGFEQLALFDWGRLKSLRDRGQMYIRGIFGPNSPYSEELASIELRYMSRVGDRRRGAPDDSGLVPRATVRAARRANPSSSSLCRGHGTEMGILYATINP